MSERVIHAVKGFNKDMTCTPTPNIKFQYKEGESYEEKRAAACETGFHACEIPVDVFRYYYPGESVYHRVEMTGDIDNTKRDKTCSSKIKIGKEISIKEIVEESINIIEEEMTSDNYFAKNGNVVGFGTTDDGDRVASSNDNNNVASCASNGIAVSFGDFSNAVSSEMCSYAFSYGNCSNACSSDHYSDSISVGTRGNTVSSGMYSASVCSGRHGTAVSSGYRGVSIANHKDSCAVAWGESSKAKGVVGSYLVLTEWKFDGFERLLLKNAKMFYVDGEKIKENTWYQLKDGEAVEVD